MKKIMVIVLALVVLLFAGCTTPVPPTEKTGKLTLSITDKKVEGLEELNVTISSVEVHKVAKTEDENTENGDSGDGSWILFSEEEKTFDLMQLDSTQGLKALLGEKELEAGKYTQIRFEVKEVKAVINGEEFDVEVPSGKLKVVKGFEIKEGEDTELIIDFSPESVIKSGDVYKLKPVLKLLTEKEFNERKQEKKITKEQAMELAQNSECAQNGTLGQKANYNGSTKTWWIDLEPTEEMPGCNPACVVSEDETVEINYRCTGLEQQGKGLFTLLLSDAEADIADFESVNVSFERARIFLKDSNTGFTEADLNGTTVDLTTVIGELAVPLVELELTAGTYSKVELYVLGVDAVLLDGNTAEVSVPSNKLQIIRPFTIEADTETKFVFDIQVVKKGQTNEYNLRPVIAKSGVVGKDLREEEVEEIEPEEKAVEVDDSEFLEDVCDANTSCPTDYECAQFPGLGLKCYPIEDDPCDFVDCHPSQECVIAESYPVQVMCSDKGNN